MKKIKDYAFVHFEDRDQAVEAMKSLNYQDYCGTKLEISLAKPPSDKKKKEEMLRKREQRMMQAMAERLVKSHCHRSQSLIEHRCYLGSQHLLVITNIQHILSAL